MSDKKTWEFEHVYSMSELMDLMVADLRKRNIFPSAAIDANLQVVSLSGSPGLHFRASIDHEAESRSAK